ncbi:hypothetical protein ACHQM5_012469 [Ranunculus cassubicifolius]
MSDLSETLEYVRITTEEHGVRSRWKKSVVGWLFPNTNNCVEAISDGQEMKEEDSKVETESSENTEEMEKRKRLGAVSSGQEMKEEEIKEEMKKKKSSWLPDPDRRWPVQGW